LAGIIFSLLVVAAHIVEIPHFDWVGKILGIDDYVTCDVSIDIERNNIPKIFLIYIALWCSIGVILYSVLKYLNKGKYIDKFRLVFFGLVFVIMITLTVLETLNHSQTIFGFCGHYFAKMLFITILGLWVSIYVSRSNA